MAGDAAETMCSCAGRRLRLQSRRENRGLLAMVGVGPATTCSQKCVASSDNNRQRSSTEHERYHHQRSRDAPRTAVAGQAASQSRLVRAWSSWRAVRDWVQRVWLTKAVQASLARADFRCTTPKHRRWQADAPAFLLAIVRRPFPPPSPPPFLTSPSSLSQEKGVCCEKQCGQAAIGLDQADGDPEGRFCWGSRGEATTRPTTPRVCLRRHLSTHPPSFRIASV